MPDEQAPSGEQVPPDGHVPPGEYDFGDDIMDGLGGAQLPEGAPVSEQGGGMGVPRSRLHDLDKDGIYDHVEYDMDGDGDFETKGRITTDAQGNSNVVGADGEPLFGDETTETASTQSSTQSGQQAGSGGADSLEMQDGRFLDTNRDGVYDRWEQDADGDGIAERSGRIERRDGEVYLRDEEGNPLPAQRAEPLNDAVMDMIDMAPDRTAEPVELDVGGHRTRLTDTNADGIHDVAEGDLDGDGEFDTRGRFVTDEDGTQRFVSDAQGPTPEDVAVPDGGNVESFESDMTDFYAGDDPSDRAWKGNDFMQFRDEDHDGKADLVRGDIDGDGDIDGTGRITYDEEGRAEYDMTLDRDEDGIADTRVRQSYDDQGRKVTEIYDETGKLISRQIDLPPKQT
ncbi:MAG: hypothetical protein GY929_21335 [Actinomycetia bacterium]|nr:hypothetical protein [Actinomycetes bacterium]